MAADEPDISALFAPVDISTAVLGVLGEARIALSGIDDPVDAELWGSDVLGALSSAAGSESAANTALADVLIPAATQVEPPERPTSLAVLRVLAAIGDPALRTAAERAATRLSQLGALEPPWAAAIGSPRVAECWHYADTHGNQESVTLAFGYGGREHAISVLIDHAHGGKVKDVWLTKGDDRLLATELAAGSDPRVEFGLLDPRQAADRIRQALATGERPEERDQADDITAHRALLRVRLERLV